MSRALRIVLRIACFVYVYDTPYLYETNCTHYEHTHVVLVCYVIRLYGSKIYMQHYVRIPCVWVRLVLDRCLCVFFDIPARFVQSSPPVQLRLIATCGYRSRSIASTVASMLSQKLRSSNCNAEHEIRMLRAKFRMNALMRYHILLQSSDSLEALVRRDAANAHQFQLLQAAASTCNGVQILGHQAAYGGQPEASQLRAAFTGQQQLKAIAEGRFVADAIGMIG